MRRGGREIGQRWESKSHYNQLAINADQVEWQAVLHGSAHIMAGTMDDEMSEAADQEIAPEARKENPMEGKNIVLEYTQGTATEIIVERIKQLGDAYPFDHVQNSLIYKQTREGPPLYELMLGISQTPSLTKGAYVQLPRVFEQLSKLAGMAFLGPHADGYHTGWPRPDSHSRFKSVIDDLRKSSGEFSSEWEWSPGSDLPSNPLPAYIKDGGLDIVAWRPWSDARGAHLYLLGQCACGQDWLQKTTDLDAKRMRDWFKPPRVEPLRSFFTPHYAVKALIHEHSRDAGLMFDRVRIVHMLNEPHILDRVVGVEADIRAALAIAKQEKVPAAKRARVASKKSGVSAKRRRL